MIASARSALSLSSRRFLSTSSYSTILSEIKPGKVGLITLNRPKALNALSPELVGELAQAATELDADPAVGCIVVTGAGDKAFAAGADIKVMGDKSYMDMYKSRLYGAEFAKIQAVKKPIIAAVNGFCLGGGCELAMSFDFILAADTAKFGQPEIKLGTIPGLGGTQRFTRALGKARAMELCLTGGRMGAEVRVSPNPDPNPNGGRLEQHGGAAADGGRGGLDGSEHGLRVIGDLVGDGGEDGAVEGERDGHRARPLLLELGRLAAHDPLGSLLSRLG